jgi:hypothetical protein
MPIVPSSQSKSHLNRPEVKVPSESKIRPTNQLKITCNEAFINGVVAIDPSLPKIDHGVFKDSLAVNPFTNNNISASQSLLGSIDIEL